MIKRLQNKKRMIETVTDKLEKNNDKLSVVPVLPAFVLELRQKIDQINSTHEVQLGGSEGFTQTKKDLREKLTTGLLAIINRAKTYALVTNDQLLKSTVNYAAYQLEVMSQENFASLADRILNACASHINDLKDYGLTEQMISETRADHAAYVAAKTGPKQAIVTRKSATSGLVILFSEADEVLVKIDAMMEIVRETEPALYADYKSLRMIDNLRGKSKPGNPGETGISGTVGNMETGDDLPGVKVSIAGTSYSTTTDTNGNYSFALPAGTYTLTASLSGFADYTEEDIDVTEGEYAEVDFDMEASK